jgi:hypothetical protein
VHFFHLSPSQFLLDRSNFLRALLRYTCTRAVYHSDAERAEEEEHNRVKLARLVDALDGGRASGKAVAASSGPSAAVSSNPSSIGRIVFTTSSDSLPPGETVLCVSALLKFEDASSNAGGCSHEYLLLHAANGSVHARKVSFDTGGATRRRDEQRSNAAAAQRLQQEQLDEDDDEERNEGDDAAASASASASPTPVQDDDPGCPIPLSALPLDIAQFVRANPDALIPAAPVTADAAHSSAASASSSSSSSSPSITGASPLSTSRTSCLLLVYGCALERDSVRRGLLQPSIRNARPYEKPDSRWNAEVKRQLEDINKV